MGGDGFWLGLTSGWVGGGFVVAIGGEAGLWWWGLDLQVVGGIDGGFG